MSYDARVFNVMIASPSDVASEREIVREVIYEWNAVHSERENVVLLPVGWESHSSPEMGARPQEIINKQTLDKCDLLVGIFGTRLGTDTGEYPSGTVEEIEEHIALGKPVMLYFSKRLGDSDTFDKDQYDKLEDLRKDYESRGLYGIYDGDVDFRNKFTRHLQITVNEHKLSQLRGEEMNSGLDRSESERKIPQLSDIAKILLKEASQSDTGSVLHYRGIDVDAILINDSSIIPNQRPRVVAEWIAALQELVETSLLGENSRADSQRSDTSYRVTHRGYEVADMI